MCSVNMSSKGRTRKDNSTPRESQAVHALMWAIAAVVATILAELTIGAGIPHTQSTVLRDMRLSPKLQATLAAIGVVDVSSTAYAAARSSWSKKKRFSLAALGQLVGATPVLVSLYHALNVLTSLPHEGLDGFWEFVSRVHAIRNPALRPQGSFLGQVGAAFQQYFQVGIDEQVREAMQQHSEYLPAVGKVYAAIDVMQRVGVSFQGETGSYLQSLRSDLDFVLKLMHSQGAS